MDSKRHLALVVDDSEPTRALIARILEQELGVRSILAGTCEEALRLAAQTEFDVILLDLLMPGIGGFEVLRAIRYDSKNIETPVIILSVLDDRQSVERCIALKAHAFVTKPVNRGVIAGMVKAHLPEGPSSTQRPWQRGS